MDVRTSRKFVHGAPGVLDAQARRRHFLNQFTEVIEREESTVVHGHLANALLNRDEDYSLIFQCALLDY